MQDQPTEAPVRKKSSAARRIVAGAVICVVLFGLLWYTIFTAVTAALVATGVTGVVVIGSSVSEFGESILDMLTEMVLGIFAAIAAFFAAIFSIFN